MTHDEGRDLAALYVLGALTPDELAVFEDHLATCRECQAEVTAHRPVANGLLTAVPERTPPPALRQRILATAIGTTNEANERSASGAPGRPLLMLATAAALTLAVGAAAVAFSQRTELAQARTALTVLTAPDVVHIELKGQSAAPRAVARAYWSRFNGLVFTASHLPVPPRGRAYQLWIVAGQSPISAGMVRTTATGEAVMVVKTPTDIPPPSAIAVTMEPEGGAPAPTGDKYLVGTPTTGS